MALACDAIDWVIAVGFPQSSVASTSLRRTTAPGRTSTLTTYADRYWGPTLASTQGSRVPTYERVSRYCAASASMVVTGRGLEPSATLLTDLPMRQSNSPPTVGRIAAPRPITAGMRQRRCFFGTTGSAGGAEGVVVSATGSPDRLSARSQA